MTLQTAEALWKEEKVAKLVAAGQKRFAKVANPFAAGPWQASKVALPITQPLWKLAEVTGQISQRQRASTAPAPLD